MGTSPADPATLIVALAAPEWPTILQGLRAAEELVRGATPGETRLRTVIDAVVRLSAHPKWEVRRAIANLAAQTADASFEPVLARFVGDDNALVREAARRAALRRRDWQNAGAFGKQHADRINATLDDIESRFGVRGREAVKRASEQIADTFARELYHEMIKLLAPVANSAERLKTHLTDADTPRSLLVSDATTIGRRVTHLKAVLDAMRAYTAPPRLTFRTEDVSELVAESLGMVREGDERVLLPTQIVGSSFSTEVCRSRLVQALTNLLVNAMESYEGISDPKPISIRLEQGDGWGAVLVEDFGCGMSTEVLADAAILFTTSKPGGTGFGLPLAKKIVESEHTGRLSLSSEKGRGTVVRIAFPTLRPGEPQ